MLNVSKCSLKRLPIQIPNIRKTPIENIKPILFDVSLRNVFTQLPLQDKKSLFYNILWNYNPSNFEIGSLLNPKMIPHFLSSLDLVEELNLPPVKIHCSVLAEDAIKAAINDYRVKNGEEPLIFEEKLH